MIAFGWHEIPDDIRADLHIFTLCKHDAVGPDIVDCIPGYDDAGAPADADAAMEFGEVRSRYGDARAALDIDAQTVVLRVAVQASIGPDIAQADVARSVQGDRLRSEEHTSELQSLMRIS